jgi:outer membrane protein assembly factor BamA
LYIKSFILKTLKHSSILLLVLSSIFYSCNPTKQLKPNQLFLQKIKIKKDNRKIDSDEIEGIIKQQPNRKILGVFRFHLGIFNYSPVKRWRAAIGEPPVVYDSLLTDRTIIQLNLHLKNKGYFQNQVSYSTSINKNKIKVKYDIKSGPPYIVKWVDYEIEDTVLAPKIILKKYKTLIKRGKPLDLDVLDKERERVKKVLKDEGYYYFNTDYVRFKVDSTIGNKNVNVTTVVLNKKNTSNNDTLKTNLEHKKYYLNSTKIYLSKNFKDKNVELFDTTSFKGITIYYDDEKLKYRPRMLRHAINLHSKDLYRLSNQQNTYKHLSELKLFKTVSIQFNDAEDYKLDSKIYLIPQKTQSLSLETVGTNSGGNLGLEGSAIYLHKNLFHGGERLTVKVKGGLEIQQLINETEETPADISFLNLPFNTLEFGPEVNLEFPRFLLPITMDKFSLKSNPKTSLNYLLNFQDRPEYVRNLTKVTFGYFWNQNKFIKHYVNPIDISIIKLKLSSGFKNRILAENNPFIVNSFTDHFINATTYTFLYTNQTINKVRDFKYLRFNAEIAGNIQTAYNSLRNASKNENGSYEILGIQYAQYVKGDIDYRYYNKTPATSLVSRITFGVGLPYDNLEVLPFEKSYYGGGANDIRAWQARTLGPGSLPDSLISTSLINQIGELKIEGNLEYRFDITKLFEGAIFADAGNIWTLKPDEKRPNSEIKVSRLWQDIAIGVGVGLRLDFNFFLIRFDLAAKLKDPASTKPKELDFQWKTPTLNLGIGYPF